MLFAINTGEGLVTSTYLPWGDWPARVDLLLDGCAWDRVVVRAEFWALERRVLHGLFQADPRVPVDLARWKHHRQRMPWELPIEATASPATRAANAAIGRT